MNQRNVRYRKRVTRFNEPGHAHYLTFSCNHRWPLLEDEFAKKEVIKSLAAARNNWRFDLWAYVIMPEHCHVLIWPREAEYSVGKILHGIKRPAAYRILSRLRQTDPVLVARLTVAEGDREQVHFWLPGGGYDSNTVEPKACHSEADYIHGNPVRRCLVAEPTDWPWSSARFWAGGEEVPLEMDRTMPVVME